MEEDSTKASAVKGRMAVAVQGKRISGRGKSREKAEAGVRGPRERQGVPAAGPEEGAEDGSFRGLSGIKKCASVTSAAEATG